MNEISIFDAWTSWLSGHLSPNATIWGVSIFWWGRIGKIMQVIGAITIIADIIGPEKIRKFGSSLHGAITPAILIQFLNDCFDWYKVIFRYTLMKDYTDEITIERRQPRLFKLDILNYLICFLLTVIVTSSIELKHTGWVFLTEAAIIFFCLLGLCCMIKNGPD